MSAPERIWADPPSLFDGVDLWHEKQEGAELTAVEYIRKDASDTAIAAARAEGVREGMLKAAEVASAFASEGKWADGFIMAADIAAAIRAAAEAQP